MTRDVNTAVIAEGAGPAALEGTAGRILEAARRLIAQQHPAALSVARIAEAAGVSHRTVYRYFPTKEALIRAVAERPSVPQLRVAPKSYAEAPGALRVAWHWMAEHLDELRGERAVPGGIELRRARVESARRMIEGVLRDAGVADGPKLERLREVLVLLTSSGALLELMDRHGHDVDAAVDIVIDAMDALIANATTGEET